MSKPVRTRFAPSPTGLMHVGGVRTALFAWLVARQNQGKFILRVEDTDKTRQVKGAEAHIMEALRWLGLEWDEGPDKDGPHGPYRQSQRLAIYKEWGLKLVKAGRAYLDPFTPEQLEDLRQKSIAAKQPFLFRDHRPANLQDWSGQGALRFLSHPKPYQWTDAVMGRLSSGPEVVDDFILVKADGYPTYNFAHIVDDNLMKITHVIRSQEFLPSVPKFLNLYEALEIKAPLLVTLPYVLEPNGRQKLSKRYGAKDILDYAREGYLPAALMNFLATLGWNDGTTQEVFSVKELVTKFDLNRVQRGGAKFDDQRLKWLNGHHIRALEVEELYDAAADFWPPHVAKAPKNYKLAILGLVQERLKYLAELTELTGFFFEAPKLTASMLVEKLDKKVARSYLSAVAEIVKSQNFKPSDLEVALRARCDEFKARPMDFFGLIRRAVTGGNISPPLPETLLVLGQKEAAERLEAASKTLA